MLANRGMSVSQFAIGLGAEVDLDALLAADQDLSLASVVALAARFKKTWPYLLIDDPEVLGKYGRDNRTAANQRYALSAELLDHHARVETMLEWAGDLFPEIAFQVPAQLIGTDTSVADAGEAIREFLGVSFDEQIKTKGEYEALRLWSDALQARGIYVQMRRLNDLTVRAFSIAAGEQAAVVADTQDIPHARVFSLLHEYVHIVLRSAGICDLDEQLAVERYCNAVAAEILMPLPLMLREASPAGSWGQMIDGDEDRVAAVSSRLGVSKASLLIRLRDLDFLSQASYEVLETRRAARTANVTRSRGGDYHRNVITKVGRRFAKRVVGAYDFGSIDRRDASTLLEIPEHNFPNFRDALSKVAGAA